MDDQTTLLYRPVGAEERALIAASGYSAFPPRLAWQPIFYPVLHEEYATWITRNWNARDGKRGYVTRFAVDSEFLSHYDVQKVGAGNALEYWIPAEDLDTFNQHIVGKIDVIAEYP